MPYNTTTAAHLFSLKQLLFSHWFLTVVKHYIVELLTIPSMRCSSVCYKVRLSLH